MANQGLGFVQGFSPYLRQTTRDIIGDLYSDAEKNKQKRQRELILNILKGGEPILNPISGDKIDRRSTIQSPGVVTSQVAQPYSRQDKINKLSDLYRESGQGLEMLNSLLTPQDVKGIKVDNTYYGIKPGTTNVPDLQNPLAEIPQNTTKNEVVDAGSIKGQESYKGKGYLQKVRRTYDPKGNLVKEELVNNPYAYKETKKDENGKDYTKLSDDAFKEYDKKWKTWQNALSVKNAFENKQNPYFITPMGQMQPYTANMVEAMVNSAKTELQDYVDRNRSKEATSYANTNWGMNDTPSTIWKKTYSDYVKGIIQPSTFQELLYQFRLEFGVDPIVKYAGQ